MGILAKIITTITKSVLLIILVIGQSYSQEIDQNSQFFFIYDESSPSHLQFFHQLKENISPQFRSLEKFDIKDFNNSPKSKLATQAILITIGTEVFEKVLQSGLANPILAALIPAQSYYSLVNSYPKNNIKAWFINQPIKRRIALIKTVLPSASKYGLLINKSYEFQLNDTIDEFDNSDLQLIVKRVPPTDSPIKSGQELFGRIEALFTLVDPKILNRNTAKGILLSSYRKNIPVIAYSNSYVQAGALAAVYSTPEQLARHLAEDLNNFIDNNDEYLTQSFQYPKYFSVAFNNKVARSLSIKPLSEEVIHKNINQYKND